ncbi:flagellin N-terminal helical region [Lachnospiraceae bacterium XBB1006]|nr:flagellin N-terminal helical region [Lachnospiraceae bacterium XBB1006]
MRITNSMMTLHSQRNINTTKELQDKYFEQTTTQKKISKPSDDPVVAIRSLRLRDSLNEVNQYVEKNIPDASSWLENTESALKNMEENLRDAYKACEAAANGTLTTEDKNAIMQNLSAIAEHVYQQGNTDYAGRTVFTGYKTNKTLTFQEDTTNLRYDIDESFSVKNITQKNEYTNTMTIPTNWNDGDKGLDQGYPLEKEMGEYHVDRIRLAYAKVGEVAPDMNVTVLKGGKTVMGSFSEFAMVDANTLPKSQKDKQLTTIPTLTTIAAQMTADEASGRVGTHTLEVKGNVQTERYITADNTVMEEVTVFGVDATGANTTTPLEKTTTERKADGSYTKVYEDFATNKKTATVKAKDATTGIWSTKSLDSEGKVGQFQMETISLQEWEKNKFTEQEDDPTDTTGEKKVYKVPNPNTVYYIPETGELILGENVSQAFKQDALNRENNKQEAFKLDVTYEKSVFMRSEVRPEMYFNCVDKTNPDFKEHIAYTRQQQDISYTIAMEQELKVNTQAGQDGILSTDIGRDIEELVNAIRASLSADEKVKKVEALKENPLYADEEHQAKLAEWEEAANREKTYLEDNLRLLFTNGITAFQNYQQAVTLAKTDVGSRVSRLELTKTRMNTSKETLNNLIKDNEDRELSDILIDYKAALNSYDSSLKAAAKINELSLLNYL